MQRSDAPNPVRADDRPSVVLVVDDEKGPRESLRMILASGYRVLAASSAERALEILRNQPVDLVTTDLNMPGIKGDRLAGIIRDEFPETEVIVISGFATVEAAVESIRQGVSDFLTKPFDIVEVRAAITRALERQRGRRRLVEFLEDIGCSFGRDHTTDEILREFNNNESLGRRLRSLLDRPEDTQQCTRENKDGLDPEKIEFLELLSNTIERRDSATRGHARRVSFYAGLIADSMKLDDTTREHTRIAAFLHDLGKLGCEDQSTPIDQLHCRSPRPIDNEHPATGESLLRSLGLPATITGAVRHHHERWDGKGSPDGLRGDQTPLIARIIAVADAFDALVRDRSDSPNLRRRAALRELQAGAGSRFDPRIVCVLCEISQVPARDQTHDAPASAARLPRSFTERRSLPSSMPITETPTLEVPPPTTEELTQ